jgi:hypothetical protein
MFSAYHRPYLLDLPWRQKRVLRGSRLRALMVCAGAASIGFLTVLAGCDPVQIVEGSDTHVSIRYDGIANGLDAATRLAQSSCGQYGKTAKLRKTYQEGLGIGERFAFFDCI